VASPRIEIEYCPKCRWLLRAAWLAQELLVTFEEDVGEVALIPSRTSGAFEIRVGEEAVFTRAPGRGLPDLREVKQRSDRAGEGSRPLGSPLNADPILLGITGGAAGTPP
jgi:selenoprotein W-related protein